MTVSVEPRQCESCERPLGSTARPDRRYCGAACRQAGYERRRRTRTRASHEGTLTAAEPSSAQLAELERVLERATSEVVLVGIVAKAAQSNWRAASWLLSRRWPERWASRRPVDDEPTPAPTEPDPFAEVDQLAARRQQHEYGPKPKRR